MTCIVCGSPLRDPSEPEGDYPRSSVIEERQPRYGDARDHFARTIALMQVVFGGDKRIGDLEPQDWAVIMMCDKLARFAHMLPDEDSMIDESEYAALWFTTREPKVDAAARMHAYLRDLCGFVDELLSE